VSASPAAPERDARRRSRRAVRLADGLLAALVVALVVQYAAAAYLAPWINDQGRDGLWSEHIVTGDMRASHGPDASGLVSLGPAYYDLLAFLLRLGVPNWHVGALLVALGCAASAAVVVALGVPRSRWVALAGVGLWFSHAALLPAQRMATNPAWLPLLATLELLVLRWCAAARDDRAQVALFAAAAAMLAVGLQFHLSAVLWAPALLAGLGLVRRRARWVALAAGATVGFVSLVALVGGPERLLELLRPSRVGTIAGLGVASLPVRLVHWLALPVVMANWWRAQGALSIVGFAGASLHWLALLGGVAALTVVVIRRRDAQRGWNLVLLAWAASGLVLLPVLTGAEAFYYLMGALPALYLAAATGLRALPFARIVVLVVLALANVTVVESDAAMRRTGELVTPPGAFWWTTEAVHFPVLAADLDTLSALRRYGVGFGCAVTAVHGRRWMGAMVDGGYLASRLLPAAAAPCRELTVSASRSGRVEVVAAGAATVGWPPAVHVPSDPRIPSTPALRPFTEVFAIPADGRRRTVSAFAQRRPAFGCPPSAWQPLGFSRFELALDGRTPCVLRGAGEPAWVDIVAAPQAAGP
jgi:hypothetical protein